MKENIRIGTGAGYSGDRIEPAVDLAQHGSLDYLIFECLAERTIALAQQRKLLEPDCGYDPLLEARLKCVLPFCVKEGTRIITNMGAANPRAAAEQIQALLKELGLTQLKIGVVEGDDILTNLTECDFSILKEPEEILRIKERIVSANAYLGVQPVLEALDVGADIIITGRICDTSLFLAPMMFEFGIREHDWELIGKGIATAHLLECGAQVTGGYLSDPGYKDVCDLAHLGFPIAEVYENGDAYISKLPAAGGEVSLRTCKEQLLYEVHDPTSYITADGIADFTTISLEEVEKNVVKVSGGGGSPYPKELKVCISFKNGYVGEAQISYGGEGARKRAELAAEILKERFKSLDLALDELRFDYIGIDSLWPNGSSSFTSKEIRLRVVGRAIYRDDAKRLCNEVEALYTNGPAGGGGVSKRVHENIAITSAFIPRENVMVSMEILEAENEKN